MKQMGGGVAIFVAPPETKRNSDADNRYRQESDILYLTGFAEPETVVVLRPEAEEERFSLFVRPRDPSKEVWTGRRAGTEGAKERYGADAAYTTDEVDEKMPELLLGATRLYYRLGIHFDFDRRVIAWMETARPKRRLGTPTPGDILDPSALLHEMRLRKSPEELERMRRAAQITAEAHELAMRVVRPEMPEYQLEALINYHFRKSGCTSHAYLSIVGSGINGTILHYVENEAIMQDGDLVLIDAGGEFDYYAADITRTFPANGRFSKEQRQVYQIVLEAQEAAIAQCQPGNRFDDVHNAALRCLVEGLIELGVLTGEVEENLEKGSYKPYYMHRTSHWLGLDVHDVGAYTEEDGSSRVFEPGMVLTVEPGLYFGHDCDAPEAQPYKGIGVRIEDNILITSSGYENLTSAAPKTIDDIEAIACTKDLP